MKYMQQVLIISVFVALVGCSGIRSTANISENSQLGKEYDALKVSSADTPMKQLEEPSGSLTLNQAISLALMRNPGLGSFSLEIRAKEAAAYQASLYPNPELMVEMENFAGSGLYSGFQSSEATISMGQMILLAGKRGKKALVANLESNLAAWDYEARRLDVFSIVSKTFITVLAWQERVKLNEELLAVARQFVTVNEQRLSAGRISPAELSRAKVELTNARVAMTQSQRSLELSRIRLAATWNARTAQFEKVEGELKLPGHLPELKDLSENIIHNPELKRWSVEMERRRADQELQEANAIPDLNIGLGFRRLSDSGDNALVAGLSMPIPIFDANQGAIEAAEIKVNQAQWQSASIKNNLNSELSQLYTSLQALRLEIYALEEEGIPEAEKAYEIINSGYSLGKFQFLDVLSAQRTLFRSRSSLIRSMAEYQVTVTDIERLIGQPIDYTKQ